MDKDKFDIIVIGGGPGGYVAAIRAAQLGLKVVVVEREHMGGICLNWGCIPTKALLRAAEALEVCRHASKFGIKVTQPSFDFNKIIQYSRGVAEQLAKGVTGLMKKNNVQIVDGHGRLLGGGIVSVTSGEGAESRISAKHIIIATGARPRELPAIKTDGKFIWNYKHAMLPDALPKSLLVVGSGAIGMEFASFYNALGVDVSIMELGERILPQEDAEVSAYVQKSFEKRGVKVFTSTEVVSTEVKGKAVLAKFRDKAGAVHEATFERVLSAVGVVANIEDIGLNKTKVRVERGSIKTNGYLQTDEVGVYAIGDVASAPWLAHKASHEGVLCVEHIAGIHTHPINRNNIPSCTYSHPQVASVGLTEVAAKAEHKDIKVGRFPLYANGKAIAFGDTEGFAKVIFHGKTGELLGAHLVGPEVTEMIQGFVIAKTSELTEAEIMHTIFPHPTISESMHEAVLDAWGRAIHI